MSDYDQRYYSSALGRFMTPDPYKSSAGPGDPQSWNRCSYTRSDPVNSIDPHGTEQIAPEFDCGDSGSCSDLPGESGGGGGGSCGFYAWQPYPDDESGAGYWQCEFTDIGLSYYFGQAGAGSGAAGPSAGIAHKPGSSTGPAGFIDTVLLLGGASTDCLTDIHATSNTAGIGTLVGATISYTWGASPVVDASGKTVNGATPAQSNSDPTGGNSILLNLNFGWFNPANVIAGLDSGGFTTINFLAGVGASVGNPDLTVSQYHELTLLHELGHLLGAAQETDNSYNTRIFNDCIKGH